MKKKIFFIYLVLFLGFSLPCFAIEPQYNISPNGGDTFIGSKTMANIVAELNLSQHYSGDNLESLTYWTNDFISKFNISSGDLVIRNILFANDNSSNDIYMYISNVTVPGNNDWPFLYVETSKVYSSMKFTWLKNWNYNGQNISSPTLQAYPNLRYKVNNTGWRNGLSISYTVFNYDNNTIYLDNAVSVFGYYVVEGYTQNYGYGPYVLNHTAQIEVAPTPTPVPSSTPVPGGGDYSQQLDNIEYTLLGTKDEIHNMRVDINQGLDEIKDIIPTSGEIKEAQIEASTDYWGESGDLGEDEENQASGEIMALIDSLSGDLSENPAFLGLGSFKEGLLNLLSERNPQNLDFVISWGNINTSAGLDREIQIISGDSINFSKMCRDNEVLGDIQSIVRIIFNFFMAINIFTYFYNLVLSTLGIDNPYLYENPENYHSDIIEDLNTGSTTTYTHFRNPWSREARNVTFVSRKGRN